MSLVINKKFIVEAIAAFFVLCGLSYLFITFDIVDSWFEFSRAHEDWELDELTAIVLALIIAGLFFKSRYYRTTGSEQEKATNVSTQGKRLALHLTAIYILGLSIIAFLFLLSYLIMSHTLTQQQQ